MAELGSPSHIIIHTGTNDLRSQQEKVADSLRKITEKASTTFPTSKIIISTLLPRRDFHPHTIHRVNASISRDCALKPNVFLAHHPILGPDCLYDHVHLYREAVPILAKTLKDITFSRNLTNTQSNNWPAQTPPRPSRPPRPPIAPRHHQPRLAARIPRTPRPSQDHQHHQHTTRPSQHTPQPRPPPYFQQYSQLCRHPSLLDGTMLRLSEERHPHPPLVTSGKYSTCYTCSALTS